jgi:hypothetical protein
MKRIERLAVVVVLFLVVLALAAAPPAQAQTKKPNIVVIADNTIVLFTSDNGAEIFTWPDGGNHPFRPLHWEATTHFDNQEEKS